MKLFTSGWMLASVAALLNLGTTGGLIYTRRAQLFAGGAAAEARASLKPRFWSFRADDVDALVTELKAERAKLSVRQTELDIVAAHIQSEKEELEKTKSDVAAMRDQISAEIPQIQDSERKNIKSLSQTYSAMSPTAAVSIFRQMDEGTCVKLLSMMKPDKVAEILQEMSLEDKDETMTKRAARISDKLRLIITPQKPPA